MPLKQIAGRMQIETPTESESLQALYRVVSKEEWTHLDKRYHKRKGIEAGARLIPNRVDIDERSAHVDLKEETGHWEGGTV